ncbi:MAG: glutamate-5-semialdehyde dehydrogenase [Proteobacteria bacterium]|nr:MAG: glutamate-5-semialdehyde dehydrogenase [Pseudomonadota bacterium]
MKKQLKKIKLDSKIANLLTNEQKNEVIIHMANELWEQREQILKNNQKDMENAKKNGLKKALIDRLYLDELRIKNMVKSLIDIAHQEDPVGKIISSKTLENGLKIHKVKVPIGVIGIIYESRPNVTSDTAGLCFKSGNACVLKGGKEAFYSNKIIAQVLKNVLEKNSLPRNLINLFEGSRSEVAKLLKQKDFIDLIIPRGGEGLVKFVSENSLIPVIKHDKGLCHVYMDKDGDFQKALDIIINAKCQRTGVCNAIETLLVNEEIAKDFLPKIKEKFDKQKTILLGCKKTIKIIPIPRATKEDWSREYLDNKISIKLVKNVQEAIKHINKYGSQHSEAIISENKQTSDLFLNSIDASCVYVNASTRFTDGGVFGLGAEIGISTNKLHARGPVGADDLTTYKYKIYGDGQIRT